MPEDHRSEPARVTRAELDHKRLTLVHPATGKRRRHESANETTLLDVWTVLCRFRMPFERVPAFEPVVTPKSRLIRRAWARLEPVVRLGRAVMDALGL